MSCIQYCCTHNHHSTYGESNQFPKLYGVKQEYVGSNHKSKEGGKEEEHSEQAIGGWQRDRYPFVSRYCFLDSCLHFGFERVSSKRALRFG